MKTLRYCVMSRLIIATLGLAYISRQSVGASNPAAAVPEIAALGVNSGGYADAELLGEYFANDHLDGQAAFQRRDVRIDFNCESRAPGGSISVPFTSVPASGWSARWSGRLLPRFSGDYIFQLSTDGGVRLVIKEVQSDHWSTLSDQWNTPRTTSITSGSCNLKAGAAYDIRLEYRNTNGPGIVRLGWSCDNFSSKTIDTASGLATNVYNNGYTDGMKTSRDEWKTTAGSKNASRDHNGWPTQDAMIMTWEGTDKNQGTYHLIFNGTAKLAALADYAFFADQRYDAATNTTSATMVVTNTARHNFVLAFSNTKRDAASAVNSGITNVRLYIPKEVAGDTPFPDQTLFKPAYEQVLQRFVALRFMAGTNWNNSVSWSDCTRPDYSTQRYTRPGESGSESNGMAWEYRIQLCNETGKDLYINIPELANDDYITELANLIKFGSDGNAAYTSEQKAPAYPPLNSNLRSYVEYSNEVWNYGFDAWHQNYEAARIAVKDGTEEGKILSFDGETDANVLWNRQHAMQTVRASKLFRKVFGDTDMGNRVRILHFWQYNNAGWPPTARMQTEFVDYYYNNGDGKQHVSDPHPLSYYIWGAGGAAYYHSQNENGATTILAGGDFESPLMTDKKTAPTDGPWTFSGDAGVARHEAPEMPALSEQQVYRLKKLGKENHQAAYVRNGGSIATRIALPGNGTIGNLYAIRLDAALAKRSHEKLDIYVDDQKLTVQPIEPGNQWRAFDTATFQGKPGSSHDIRIVGVAPNDGSEMLAFIDDVLVTSVDATFAGDIPSTGDGETRDTFQKLLECEANWALLFGLHPSAYEGGWALGGDSGGSPLQNWEKLNDPRTQAAQLRAVEAFYKSGGTLLTFGTYTQYDSITKASKEPLVMGIDQSNQSIPPVTTNAIPVPGELSVDNRLTIWGDKHQMTAGDSVVKPGSILAWNVLVSKSTTYSLTGSTEPGGDAQFIVDGVTYLSSPSGSSFDVRVMMESGVHCVRVKATGGKFKVSRLVISTTR